MQIKDKIYLPVLHRRCCQPSQATQFRACCWGRTSPLQEIQGRLTESIVNGHRMELHLLINQVLEIKGSGLWIEITNFKRRTAADPIYDLSNYRTDFANCFHYIILKQIMYFQIMKSPFDNNNNNNLLIIQLIDLWYL